MVCWGTTRTAEDLEVPCELIASSPVSIPKRRSRLAQILSRLAVAQTLIGESAHSLTPRHRRVIGHGLLDLFGTRRVDALLLVAAECLRRLPTCKRVGQILGDPMAARQII